MYKLTLPRESRIHLVFCLPAFAPDYTLVFSELPRAPDLTETSLLREAILNHRMVKRGTSAMVQLTVHWSSLPKTTRCFASCSHRRQPGMGLLSGSHQRQSGMGFLLETRAMSHWHFKVKHRPTPHTGHHTSTVWVKITRFYNKTCLR